MRRQKNGFSGIIAVPPGFSEDATRAFILIAIANPALWADMQRALEAGDHAKVLEVVTQISELVEKR